MYKTRRNKSNRLGLAFGNRRFIVFNTEGEGGGGGGGADATTTTTAADTTTTTTAADTTTTAADTTTTTTTTTEPVLPEFMKDWAPELKGNALFKDVKDPQDLAKALVETSGKVLARPADDATAEQKAAFDAQLRELAGVPKDVKEYGLAKPADLPAEMEALYSEEGLNAFGTTALQLGLTKEQVAGLQKFDQERTQAQLSAATETVAQREQAFLAEFTKQHGANANKVLDTAGAIMDASGKQADIDIIKSAPEATRKALANILNDVAKKYIGEGQLPGGGGGGGAAKSAGELKGELQAVIAKPEYRDQFHPDHKSTLAKATELSQQIALLGKQ